MCEVRSYNVQVHSNYFILIIIGSDKEPECVGDIVRMLQQNNGFDLPKSDDDWADIPRQTVDIRRDFVVSNALREAKKKRFDSTKLLHASCQA